MTGCFCTYKTNDTECSALLLTQNGRHFADDTFNRILMKMLEFRLNFLWSLFLRVQLTIFQHWFRYWLGAGQATSHYLNQLWSKYWRIYASLSLNELKHGWVDPNTYKISRPHSSSHRASYGVSFVNSKIISIYHYSDIIMSAMSSQVTSLVIVYSSICSSTDKRKHQSYASLTFVRGIHWWAVNSPHKGPVTRKMFIFDDVIMVQTLSKRCMLL